MTALPLLFLTAALGALDLSSLGLDAVDRLAMADRLFNVGQYADALREYTALSVEKKAESPELSYRLAECHRALNTPTDLRKARTAYLWLIKKYPASRYVPRAQLMAALIAEDPAVRHAELVALDSDKIDNPTRAAALYYLGVADNSVAELERSIKLDKDGPYAANARLRSAAVLASTGSDAERQKAVDLLWEVAISKPRSALTDDAHYLAAATSYTAHRYDYAARLCDKYLETYPEGRHFADVVRIGSWCNYLLQRYADAVRLCGASGSEDCRYIQAAAHYALGEQAVARTEFEKYLKDYPDGRYRRDVELPLARIGFAEAEKSGDNAALLVNARRAADISGQAADRLRLGWALERNDNPGEAVQVYTKLAQDCPGTREAAEGLYLRALIALRASEWSAAELALNEAVAGRLDDRRRPEAAYWRGICAFHLEHPDDGAAFLREALKGSLTLDQEREARLLLADYDFNAGRIEEAKQAYTALLEKGAADRMSAQKQLQIGKLLESRICGKALTQSADPKFRQCGWALLGSIEEKAGNYAAAIEAYRKAIAELVTSSERPAAQLRLGVLECDAGEMDAAEKTLKEAIALNADDVNARAEAYWTLARVARARNDLKAARGYATVVASLFDRTPFGAKARGMLEELK